MQNEHIVFVRLDVRPLTNLALWNHYPVPAGNPASWLHAKAPGDPPLICRRRARWGLGFACESDIARQMRYWVVDTCMTLVHEVVISTSSHYADCPYSSMYCSQPSPSPRTHRPAAV